MQLLALAGLIGGLAGISLGTKTPIMDADIWWHLKVGDWILQHRSFPHTGIFSRTAATNPWVAYSWGYEVLLSRAYAWLGLMGLTLFGVLLTAGVAVTIFWMLHRLSGKFWLSWMVCLLASLSFLFNVLPRPVFFSMIFFAVVMTIVLQANRSGSGRTLVWLPLVFVLWANLHIQFVYGLVTVALFAIADLIGPGPKRMSATMLVGVFAGCVAACCMGPYTYHLFGVVIAYAGAKYPYEVLQELQPLDFKHLSDYLLAGITALTIYVTARRKDMRLFRFAVLAIAGVLAFRALRDAWFLAITAAAFIADVPAERPAEHKPFKLYEAAAVSATVALVLFLVARNTNFTTRDLDRTVSQQYPVDAVNFLRRTPVRGPLYNEFGWGGFLIWYMPNFPVAIDGRTDLYGDTIDYMTYRSASGDYAHDPYLAEAGVVLLPNEVPLARYLSEDPQFRVIYRDRLATVLVRTQAAPDSQ